MSELWTIKQHDTAPPLPLHLTSTDPTTRATTDIDLSTATRVRVLIARGPGHPPIVDRDVEVRPVDGRLEFAWEPGDTDVDGVWQAEVEITWGDGTIQTVPGGGYATFRIVPDLG